MNGPSIDTIALDLSPYRRGIGDLTAGFNRVAQSQDKGKVVAFEAYMGQATRYLDELVGHYKQNQQPDESALSVLHSLMEISNKYLTLSDGLSANKSKKRSLQNAYDRANRLYEGAQAQAAQKTGTPQGKGTRPPYGQAGSLALQGSGIQPAPEVVLETPGSPISDNNLNPKYFRLDDLIKSISDGKRMQSVTVYKYVSKGDEISLNITQDRKTLDVYCDIQAGTFDSFVTRIQPILDKVGLRKANGKREMDGQVAYKDVQLGEYTLRWAPTESGAYYNVHLTHNHNERLHHREMEPHLRFSYDILNALRGHFKTNGSANPPAN